MNQVELNDVVQNSNQCAVVRWFGTVEGFELVGLESIGITLTGYTDGTCPIDDKRYFTCSLGSGYFVLKNDFVTHYKVIEQDSITFECISTNNELADYDENRARVVGSKPSNRLNTFNQNYYHKTSLESIPGGILSRLTINDRSNNQHIASSTNRDDRSLDDYFMINNATSGRHNQPVQYRLNSQNESQKQRDTLEGSEQYQYRRNKDGLVQGRTPQKYASRFGTEFFLDDWTFQQLQDFLKEGILSQDRLFLNIISNERIVQQLVDEQINGSGTYFPRIPPKDIRVELIRLFEDVKSVFPSRTIRLRDNDYILLAILCSNNQCAYVRTTAGWAYLDCDKEIATSETISHQVSLLINQGSNNTSVRSEQALHLLHHAHILYYKLVE